MHPFTRAPTCLAHRTSFFKLKKKRKYWKIKRTLLEHKQVVHIWWNYKYSLGSQLSTAWRSRQIILMWNKWQMSSKLNISLIYFEACTTSVKFHVCSDKRAKIINENTVQSRQCSSHCFKRSWLQTCFTYQGIHSCQILLLVGLNVKLFINTGI